MLPTIIYFYLFIINVFLLMQFIFFLVCGCRKASVIICL